MKIITPTFLFALSFSTIPGLVYAKGLDTGAAQLSPRLKVMVLDAEAAAVIGSTTPKPDQWFGMLTGITRRQPANVFIDSMFAKKSAEVASFKNLVSILTSDYKTSYYATEFAPPDFRTAIRTIEIPEDLSLLPTELLKSNAVSLAHAYRAHYAGGELESINAGDSVLILTKPLATYGVSPRILALADQVASGNMALKVKQPPIALSGYHLLGIVVVAGLLFALVAFVPLPARSENAAAVAPIRPRRFTRYVTGESSPILIAASDASGQLVDFSRDGFGLRTDSNIAVGSQLTITLKTGYDHLDDVLESRELRTITGAIMWGRKEGPGFRCGFQFRGLSPEQRNNIENILRELTESGHMAVTDTSPPMVTPMAS